MGHRNRVGEHKSERPRRFICPVCKRRVTAFPHPPSELPRFFPFCSERCKLIDLGAWLDTEYRIRGKPDDESEYSSAEDPSADKGYSEK